MDDTISQIGASYRMMSDYDWRADDEESFMDHSDTLAAGLSLSTDVTPHVQKPADPLIQENKGEIPYSNQLHKIIIII